MFWKVIVLKLILEKMFRVLFFAITMYLTLVILVFYNSSVLNYYNIRLTYKKICPISEKNRFLVRITL